MTGELLPRVPESSPGPAGSEGEFLGRTPHEEELAEGIRQLMLPHAPEARVEVFLGGLPDPRALTREWVISRLMREATDYGSRTRQTARLKALELLGQVVDISVPGKPDEDTMKEAFNLLPPDVRQRKIRELLDRLKRVGVDLTKHDVDPSRQAP